MLNETFSVIFKHCAHVFSNSNLFKEHSNHFEKLVLFKSCVEINEVGWSFPTEKLYNIDMALEFKLSAAARGSCGTGHRAGIPSLYER